MTLRLRSMSLRCARAPSGGGDERGIALAHLILVHRHELTDGVLVGGKACGVVPVDQGVGENVGADERGEDRGDQVPLGLRVAERVVRRLWMGEVQEGVHVVVVPHRVECRGPAPAMAKPGTKADSAGHPTRGVAAVRIAPPAWTPTAKPSTRVTRTRLVTMAVSPRSTDVAMLALASAIRPAAFSRTTQSSTGFHRKRHAVRARGGGACDAVAGSMVDCL
ncbi:hypothetical protein TN53_23245 [Streptomyces sp. WM6386]|nr:hypothetical protein TN53_23245 [Streptomyces sp. WM6386]